jgi:multiple sugar transport system permease protein
VDDLAHETQIARSNGLGRGDADARGQSGAGALVGAAPPLTIYAFLMDHSIAGLTAGATKG